MSNILNFSLAFALTWLIYELNQSHERITKENTIVSVSDVKTEVSFVKEIKYFRSPIFKHMVVSQSEELLINAGDHFYRLTERSRKRKLFSLKEKINTKQYYILVLQRISLLSGREIEVIKSIRDQNKNVLFEEDTLNYLGETFNSRYVIIADVQQVRPHH